MKKNTLNISVLLSLLLFAGCGGSSTKVTNGTPNQEAQLNTNSVNQVPIATFSKFAISRDVSYDGQLKATDADGDELKYVIVSQPSHGSVILHDNGCFTYTPYAGYKGIDTFSYRASDDVSSCAVKTVTVNVNDKDIQTPTAPSNLTVTALTTTSLRLTWSDNSDNEKGFVIYKDGKPVCTTKANQTSFTLSCGLEAGKSYNFEVKAQNEAGTSTPATASGTTKDVTTSPLAPTELKATAVDKTSVRLAWKDNSDNESAFEVYQDGIKIKTLSAGCTCAVVSGLKEGTSYDFLVKAVNKLGSANSNTLNIITKGEATEDEKTTVAQALLGPLSEANFKIKKLDTDEVIAQGTTTKGNGTDIATAGLIQVAKEVKDNLEVGLYIVEVTGGKDVDADDDKVWDASPTENKGTLHAIMSDDAVKNGNFKVNILAEMVYQSIKDKIEESTPSELKKLIDEKASKLLSKDGDINGDGVINYDDAIAWNPADDKRELGFNYNNVIQHMVDDIMLGKSLGVSYSTEDSLITINTHNKYTNKKMIIKLYDFNLDGIFESIKWYIYSSNEKLDAIFYFEYNDKKSLVKEKYDSDADGKIDVIVDHEYDDNENLIKTKYSNSHGIPNEINEYAYDKNNKKISSTVDFDADGIIDQYDTFDDKGRQIVIRIDKNDDGKFDIIYYDKYDSKGNIIKEEIDHNADGIDEVSFFEHDDKGRQIVIRTDHNTDGIIDEIRYYEYDSKGNTIKEEIDYDADGTIDSVS